MGEEEKLGRVEEIVILNPGLETPLPSGTTVEGIDVTHKTKLKETLAFLTQQLRKVSPSCTVSYQKGLARAFGLYEGGTLTTAIMFYIRDLDSPSEKLMYVEWVGASTGNAKTLVEHVLRKFAAPGFGRLWTVKIALALVPALQR